MKKNSLAALLLATSMLVAGCAENPADNVPSASVKTPAATTSPVAVETPSEGETPASVAGVVYAFPEGTEVGFEGSKVTGSHKGGFKKVNGKVTVPEENLESAQVDLVIDMGTVYTDDEKLTGHLKSEDFFNVEKFPESTFRSTSITKEGDGYTVTGDLTLHGVTKTITFPATMTMNEDTLETAAKFAINRMDFDIVYPGKPDDLIRKEVVIEYDIKAKKEA